MRKLPIEFYLALFCFLLVFLVTGFGIGWRFAALHALLPFFLGFVLAIAVGLFLDRRR